MDGPAAIAPSVPTVQGQWADSAETAMLQAGANQGKAQLREQTDKVTKWVKEGPLGLKVICFLCTLGACVIAVLEMMGSILNPFKFIISVYAFGFAFIGMCLEVGPAVCCARCFKRRVEFWCKILGRVWGRGLLYILVSGMQFSQRSVLGYLAGTGLLAAGIFSMIVARSGRKKLKKLHGKLLAEHGKSEAGFNAAFARFDTDGSGTLSYSEFMMLCDQMGSGLNKDELSAAFALLDASNTGSLNVDEFRAFWSGDEKVDFSVL